MFNKFLIFLFLKYENSIEKTKNLHPWIFKNMLKPKNLYQTLKCWHN